MLRTRVSHLIVYAVFLCVVQGEYGSTLEMHSSQRSGRKRMMIAICASSMLLALAALTMDEAPHAQERLQQASSRLATATVQFGAKAGLAKVVADHESASAPKAAAMHTPALAAAASKTAVKALTAAPVAEKASPLEKAVHILAKKTLAAKAATKKVVSAAAPAVPHKVAPAVVHKFVVATAAKQHMLATVKPAITIAKGNILQEDGNATSTAAKPEGIIGDDQDVSSEIGNLKPTGGCFQIVSCKTPLIGPSSRIGMCVCVSVCVHNIGVEVLHYICICI